MWSLKTHETAGLWWQIQLHLQCRTLWQERSFKTNGLLWQWSLKRDFTVLLTVEMWHHRNSFGNSDILMLRWYPRCFSFKCGYVDRRWNLSLETTAMRDHLPWQTTHFWQKDLHLNITEPVTRDHLSWQTTFLWLMGWSFKTDFNSITCIRLL